LPSKSQILVVDDDPSARGFVATLLVSAGYDVTTAEDGFGALLQLRKTQPDAVVSDLDMPNMSGYELLSVVGRRFPDILTVAMSGGYQGCDVPRGVVADRFSPKGNVPRSCLEPSKSCFAVFPREAVTITASYRQLGSLASGMTRMKCPL
jgi:CheY-like chemotaxis protein